MQAKQQLEARSQAQVFEENYVYLKGLALKITNYNHELSEDLLHDFYLKMSQRESGEKPLNPMAYMFISLRNSYQSVIRKKNLEDKYISIGEENFFETLPDEKTFNLFKAQDELRAICHYACLRKATSISGSIVILRYFHGYYATEVSRIIRRTRNAVEARLVTARQEISQYLLNPNTITFNLKSKDPPTAKIRKTKEAEDLLTELRRKIFSTRQGTCRSFEEYKFIYRIRKKLPDHTLLSHIVSCAPCLERINKLLKLPKLGMRHPLDSIRQNAFNLLLLVYLLAEPAISFVLTGNQEFLRFSDLV